MRTYRLPACIRASLLQPSFIRNSQPNQHLLFRLKNAIDKPRNAVVVFRLAAFELVEEEFYVFLLRKRWVWWINVRVAQNEHGTRVIPRRPQCPRVHVEVYRLDVGTVSNLAIALVEFCQCRSFLRLRVIGRPVLIWPQEICGKCLSYSPEGQEHE